MALLDKLGDQPCRGPDHYCKYGAPAEISEYPADINEPWRAGHHHRLATMPNGKKNWPSEGCDKDQDLERPNHLGSSALTRAAHSTSTSRIGSSVSENRWK